MAAILTPGFSPTVGWCATGEARHVETCNRVAVGTGRDRIRRASTRSGQSQTPAEAPGDTLRPFLFDGRMPGDGSRQRAVAGEEHPTAGAIVMPPKASQPERER
jgi:hypothetical protein